MGVGGVEGWYGSDEEFPSSKDSPPKEDGEESGGDGGIPGPLAPGISVLVGLVVFPPKGFWGKPVPWSCSWISEKSRGSLSGLPSCLIRAMALCVLMSDWWTIYWTSSPRGTGVTASMGISRLSFEVVFVSV
jgi:hypothetical protein